MFLRDVVKEMPHRHSPAKLAERCDRAIRLGYLRPRPPGGRWVFVLAGLAPRVKSIAQSLSIQQQHAAIAGRRSHFARMASLVAHSQGRIHDAELSHALHVHRRAHHAKHDWRNPAESSVRGWPLAPLHLECQSSPFAAPDPASCRSLSVTAAGSQGATAAIAELLQKQSDAVQHLLLDGLHEIITEVPQVVFSELMKVAAALQLKVVHLECELELLRSR